MKFNPRYIYVVLGVLIVSGLLVAGAAGFLPYVPEKLSIPGKPVTTSSNPYEAARCKGGKTVFDCTVKYLQYLRYLPIYQTSSYQYKYAFPMPEDLQNIAGSYPWNPQNPFILGAIEQYLQVSGRLSDGKYLKPQITTALLSELKESAAKKEYDPLPFKWVIIRQAMKNEEVSLYENGRKVFSSPANTGEYSTTSDGTFFVYLRYDSTTMSGLSPARIPENVFKEMLNKNPKSVGCLNGHPVKWVPYSDSGILYVDYFNKSEALHYIYRAHYGFPQSAGCVELPLKKAKFLHENIGYGTMVTVSGITEPPVATKPGTSSLEACLLPQSKPKPGKVAISHIKHHL